MPNLIDSDSVNITVNEASNQIIVGLVGIQGPAGTAESATANISGLISTGAADLRYYSISNPSGYITGFNSGLYYLNSNPLEFIRSGDVVDVYYPISNPAQYITSGNVSNLYALITSLESTGSSLISLLSNYLLISQTGQFYPRSNPNNYSTSGNLAATGAALVNLINNSAPLNVVYTTGSQVVDGKIFNTSLSPFIISGNNGITLDSDGDFLFIYHPNGNKWLTTEEYTLYSSSRGHGVNFYDEYSQSPSLFGANWQTTSTGKDYETIMNYGRVSGISGDITSLIAATGGSLQVQINNLPVISNPITGAGTVNYIPKFVNGSGLGNSSIIDSGNSIILGAPTNVSILSGLTYIRGSDGYNQMQFGAFGAVYTNSTFRITSTCFLGNSDDAQIGRPTTATIFLGANNAVNIGGLSNGTATANLNLRGGNINASGMLNASGLTLLNATGNYLLRANSVGMLESSNIIDSGNSITIGVRKSNENYSGVIFISQEKLVGINTNNPEYGLTLQPTASNQDVFRINHPTSPTLAGFMWGMGNTFGISDGAFTAKVEASSTEYTVFAVNRFTRDVAFPMGKVGINSLVPISALDITGNITASGASFLNRPTVNSIPLLLSGDVSSFVLPNTIVYTTGYQEIPGEKSFTTAINTPLLYGSVNTNHEIQLDAGALSDLGVTSLDWINRQLYNQWNFNVRPTVNGTGVLLSGEGTSVSVTGGAAIQGNISIVGGYGTNVIQSGNTIIVSGGGSASSFSVPTWSNLTWNNTTIWDATPNIYEDRKILVMTGNTTLSITNLYNGWQGALQTIQSGAATSGYSLTMPANTKVMNAGSGIINLTSGSGAIDIIGLSYDGSKLFANIGNQFN